MIGDNQRFFIMICKLIEVASLQLYGEVIESSDNEKSLFEGIGIQVAKRIEVKFSYLTKQD